MKPLYSTKNLLVITALIAVLISNENQIGATGKFYKLCEASSRRHCGDNQTISFPFFIIGVQDRVCGFPNFQISCNNGNPVVKLSGDDYIIKRIFYHNQSLIVSNSAFKSSSLSLSNTTAIATCFSSPVKNISLTEGDRFSLVSNQTRVSLFYNHCLTDGCYELDRRKNSYDNCSDYLAVEAPVLDDRRSHIGDALRGGFMLTWTASDCSYCEETKGKCGFDFNTYQFRCFCPDRPHPATCGPPQGRSLTFTLGAATASVVCGVGLVIIILFFLKKHSSSSTFFFWKKQSHSHRNVETFLRNVGALQVQRYNYKDIKKMTTHFKEKLGSGGFGDVYKGKLGDNRLVAVKVLKRSEINDGQDFINEVAAISRTYHVNVVTLLGFCFEGTRRALIYEFMPNGSLEKFVFNEEIQGENSEALDWEKYYQIAIGIARGLEYLHRGCNTRIVHFDIKPHNILLDADFVPKISDFGFAKICTKKESVVSMLVPRGTIGYIAPEIVSRNFGEVSHKSDVYSYGMMVLEMVGGRRNINVTASNSSEIYFPHWIYNQLKFYEELGLKNIIDEDDKVKAKKMVIVSLWCIQTNPSNRPTMGKVIQMLENNTDCLQIPPKPILSSPCSSPPTESTT